MTHSFIWQSDTSFFFYISFCYAKRGIEMTKIKITNENNQANVYIDDTLIKVYEYDDWAIFDFLSGLDKAFEHMKIQVEREYEEYGLTKPNE